MLHQNNQHSTNIHGRDVSAFTKAYKYLFTALCAFASKIVKNVQAAQDIVSDVFTKLWEKALTFVAFEKLKSWLYTSTRNASINFSKRNRYRAINPATIETLLTDEQGKMEINTEPLFKQIGVAISTMSKQQRRVFVMAHVHNKGTEVIAKRLRISGETVTNHKRLAMNHIRQHLRSYHATH
jgi:RNA polymerase sigma-70 factor (family 1)